MSLHATHRPPLTVRIAQRSEAATALDPAVAALAPAADRLLASPTRDSVLRGMWLGHGLHPMLTDFPLGMFTSATLLDLFGGDDTRAAARRLLGWGLVSALPTAVTGLAEWGAVTGQRERRVGVIHAAANSAALAFCAASWLSRRGEDERSAKLLAVVGGVTATVGGFFGGHLTEVRKVSSSNPAFDS